MTINFVTRTGSTYLIDSDSMSWQRLDKTEKSGEVRAEKGTLIVFPRVAIGHPVFLEDTAVLSGYDSHIVLTSPVVSAEDVTMEEAP